VSHILIIDDDSDLRTIMQEVLLAEGYEVSVAADGEQGIALHRKLPASLLITDIFMPNKEGIETIRDFRKEFPTVPIIAISRWEAKEARPYPFRRKGSGRCDDSTKAVRNE
jgi:DNA-binding response OmpR family regulator